MPRERQGGKAARVPRRHVEAHRTVEECMRARETVTVQRKRGNDSGKEKEEKRWLVEERKSDREGATERERRESHQWKEERPMVKEREKRRRTSE